MLAMAWVNVQLAQHRPPVTPVQRRAHWKSHPLPQRGRTVSRGSKEQNGEDSRGKAAEAGRGSLTLPEQQLLALA